MNNKLAIIVGMLIVSGCFAKEVDYKNKKNENIQISQKNNNRTRTIIKKDAKRFKSREERFMISTL